MQGIVMATHFEQDLPKM